MRGNNWVLTRMPYGITEAGRKWQKEIEQWFMGTAGFERVVGERKWIGKKRGQKGVITMIVSKITDYILTGGDIKVME